MRQSTKLTICVVTIFFIALTASSALAGFRTVTLVPSKDNTLIERDTTLSNGGSEWIFAGETIANGSLRGLIAFDIANRIPQGAKIWKATLTLHLDRTRAGLFDFKLHKLTSEWGEGDAAGVDDRFDRVGGPAAEGDATWVDNFFNISSWGSPGGDFVAQASATATVGARDAFYVWGPTFRMIKDVQSWLDDPDRNYGWILIGPEEGLEGERRSKRFDSRENVEVSFRPTLTVVYIP